MTPKRKIAVLTSCRADYWLLKKLIELLDQSESCELQLCVIAAHLSPFAGHTVDCIEKDGFPIAAKIETLLASDTNIGMTKSIGLTIICAAEQLSQLKPELVVLLGDRFEVMAFAQAAYSLRIPIAHIHGGEKTSGALDDVYRHVITKLSSLHFVAHADYADRVAQLGEKRDRIFVVGAMCLDQIKAIKFMARNDLLQKIRLSPQDKYVLFCYHPTTASSFESDELAVRNALDELLRNTNYKIIITQANVDPTGSKLNEIFREYEAEHASRVKIFGTLGGELYYNAVQHSECFIGNSSSGIIEVPYFHKPSINIGSRQDGRKRSDWTLQCDGSKEGIAAAIAKLSDKIWLANIPNAVQGNRLKGNEMIYGDAGGVAKKVYDIISTINLGKITEKGFVDLM